MLKGRTCWIHAGTHKTGTTFLQGLLKYNEPALKKEGYYLPATGRVYDSAAQHQVAWELDGTFTTQNGKTMLQALEEELSRVRDPNVLLSSEEFEYLYCKPGSLKALKNTVESAGFRPKIIFFLREQVSLARSVYVEMLKGGLAISFGEFLADLLEHGSYSPSPGREASVICFDYRKLVESFATVFGEENVLCAPYQEKIRFTLFRIIGLPGGIVKIPRWDLEQQRNFRNKSIGSLTAMALQKYNKDAVENGFDGDLAALGRRRIIEACAKNDSDNFAGVSGENIQAIEARFAENRKWLAEARGILLPSYSGPQKGDKPVRGKKDLAARNLAEKISSGMTRDIKEGKVMNIPPLLISCTNQGGLVFHYDGQIYVIRLHHTTGIVARESKIHQLLPSGEKRQRLISYTERGISVAEKEIEADDVHDIRLVGETLYIASTGTNEFVATAMDGTEIWRRPMPGNGDAWHLNCLGTLKGRVLYSAFGRFKEHREFKGKTSGSGFVADLETGEEICGGLSQPHTLVEAPEGLYLCSSETSELLLWKEGKITRRIVLDGYARGVALDKNSIYVGLSRPRYEQDPTETGAIAVLNRQTWEVRGKILMPFREVYEIHIFQDQPMVMQLLQWLSSPKKKEMKEEWKKFTPNFGYEASLNLFGMKLTAIFPQAHTLPFTPFKPKTWGALAMRQTEGFPESFLIRTLRRFSTHRQ